MRPVKQPAKSDQVVIQKYIKNLIVYNYRHNDNYFSLAMLWYTSAITIFEIYHWNHCENATKSCELPENVFYHIRNATSVYNKNFWNVMYIQ